MQENVLNDLSPSEWVDRTATFWRTTYPADITWEKRKALRKTKSPQAMRDIIEFFTKAGDSVLDPLAGVGSTLIGAVLCERMAVGIELNPQWAQVFEEIKGGYRMQGGVLVPHQAAEVDPCWRNTRMIRGDCLECLTRLRADSVDFVLCDPPHGVMGREDESLPDNLRNKHIGNAKDMSEYVEVMKVLGDHIWRVLKPNRYWVIVMRDRYQEGEYIPLTYQLANRLTNNRIGCNFTLKAIKVWVHEHNRRSLKPFRIGETLVPNIVHDNLIILGKEKC